LPVPALPRSRNPEADALPGIEEVDGTREDPAIGSGHRFQVPSACP